MTLNRRQILVRLTLGGMLALFPFSLMGEKKEAEVPAQDGYTINYNTVSLIEYVKFASKICNVNFIFEEADLQFTVTVVSDAPITKQNVMATLLQLLRIHGLTLLEQGNSLVIHKNQSVRQMASLVFDDGSHATEAPIVTRVFRLRNVHPDSVATIIRPMISDEALIEISQETRQLILTDVTASVDKVAALIENLDAPHSILEIRSFEAKFNKPEYLIELGSQIMNPIAQGNPFIMVPQSLANAVFIVSTPELNAKAIMVLTSLDTPPKKEILAELQKRSDVLVVKLEYRQGSDILKGLKEIAASLQEGQEGDTVLMATVDSAKWIPDTNSLMFIGTPSVNAKLKEFISALDVVDSKSGTSFFVYKPENHTAEELEKSILEMADNLSKSGGADEGFISELRSAKVNPSTNTLIFSGSPASFPRIRELLANADASAGKPTTPIAKSNFAVYKIQVAEPEDLQEALKSFSSNLAKAKVDDAVVRTIDTMKYIKQTNSLLFTGPDDALQKVQQLVVQFDTGSAAVPNSSQFLIYKPKFQRGDQIAASIKDLKDNLQSSDLKDPALIRAINSMKWIKNTNSIVFTGDPNSLKRIGDLLATIDVASTRTSEKNFIIYKPQYVSREKTEDYLKQLADHLNRNSDAPLIEAIRSIKWIEPSQSFMFYGTAPSLERIRDLLQSFDTASSAETKTPGFFLYPLKYASEEKAQQYLDQVTDNLSKKEGDPTLILALQSRKWIPQSNSFMFSGSDPALAKIKEMLDSFDTAAERGPQKPGYVLYKVQNTTGDMIEEDLENLVKNMQATGMKDSPLVKALQNARYVKETNSILLTGDEDTVKEAETLISKYDYPRKAPDGPGNFYMYKPQHATASAIEKSLKDVASNLRNSSLADPSLLSAIDSMKHVDTTNSLIFTGSPEAIQKVQTLLKDIDVPPEKHAPIQHVGKSTFLLYKLQHASPNQITTSLKAITNDLKKSGAADKAFISALGTMKYVKETNSLMFTGTEESLNKVQTLVEKFDVTGLAPKPVLPATETGPSNFFIYRPQSLSGQELERTLADFAENLKASGLNDPGLFHSIETMKFVSNTQSLVFTGDTKSLDRVKELLKEFDIPANLPAGAPTGDQQIQAIDNTSFLVYKLQFHKGDEIQGALRQIAKDLLISNAPINQNLLNSINSIQWLEVTNSLLCSGDQETLTRLRELIKNLDIPLKQVFIEILVLQTSLTNAVDFGLEWGGKLKYKNKFSGSFNNFLPTDTVSTGTFSSNLQEITATATPVPTDIPFNSGFDLGVIGDIIMHKGNSFLSLGSLLTAIQTDNETTIVLTPKIITQDSKTSSIFVGQNVPFAGSFISNQSANTVTTSNLEYRDIGFNLTITPVLGNSDIITMEISIDSSSESSVAGTGATFNFQAGQATGITTNRATMQTTVHIPDKHFLILSGMVNNSTNKQTAGIPCLGGIPVIGAAFTQNNQTESLNSLVIFMRPTIVNSLDDMKKLTADQEDFFRDQTGTPFLEHNFDEAMEYIKSPDDE